MVHQAAFECLWIDTEMLRPCYGYCWLSNHFILMADLTLRGPCFSNTNLIQIFFLQRIISWRMWISASSLCRRRMLMVWIALLELFEAVLPELSTWSLQKWTTMNLVSTQKRSWKPPNYWQTQVLHKRDAFNRPTMFSLQKHIYPSCSQEVHIQKQ